MNYDDQQVDEHRGRDHRTRVIDLRLPLPWLLSSAAAICLTLVGMYFQLRQVSSDVTDLKISVKAGNNQQNTVQGELAILRFRIETLESDKRAGAR